jgi:hypothetical protein
MGPAGEAFLTELVHQRPQTWQGCIVRAFTLLEQHGEARFRPLLQRALRQRLFRVENLEQLAVLPHYHDQGESCRFKEQRRAGLLTASKLAPDRTPS